MEEPVKARKDSGIYEIDPDTNLRLVIRILWEKGRFRINFVKEFTNDGAFVEGFIIVLECRD